MIHFNMIPVTLMVINYSKIMYLRLLFLIAHELFDLRECLYIIRLDKVDYVKYSTMNVTTISKAFNIKSYYSQPFKSNLKH